MGYLAERPHDWARWWIGMWAANTAVLIALAFVLTFRQWTAAAVVGFGVPEGFALLRHRDPYPPLTHVTRYFLPKWLTFTTVFGAAGAVGAAWFGFPAPARMGAFASLLGWLIAHFDTVYSETHDNDCEWCLSCECCTAPNPCDVCCGGGS